MGTPEGPILQMKHYMLSDPRFASFSCNVVAVIELAGERTLLIADDHIYHLILKLII